MNPDPDLILYRDNDVYSVDFSPEGSLLASAHAAGSVHVCYPMIDGELWRFNTGFDATVVRFSPDGRLLAAGGDEPTLLVWDVSSGKCKEIITSDSNLHLSFNRLTNLLASVDTSGTCSFWDAQSGEYAGELELYGDAVAGFSFSPDGTLLAACQGSEVRIWDVVRSGLLRSFHGHQSSVATAAFSPDGRHVASGDSSGDLIFWDVHTLNRSWSASLSNSRILSLAFDHSGSRLLTASDNHVRILDARTGDLEMMLFLPDNIYELSFSNAARCLAVALGDSLQIWYEGSTPVSSERFPGATAEGWIWTTLSGEYR